MPTQTMGSSPKRPPSRSLKVDLCSERIASSISWTRPSRSTLEPSTSLSTFLASSLRPTEIR